MFIVAAIFATAAAGFGVMLCGLDLRGVVSFPDDMARRTVDLLDGMLTHGFRCSRDVFYPDAETHWTWYVGCSTFLVSVSSRQPSFGHPTPAEVYRMDRSDCRCKIRNNPRILPLVSNTTFAAMLHTGLTLLVLAGLGWIVKHIRFCQSFPPAPGPPSARWSKIWYLLRIWQGNFEQYDIDAHCGGSNPLPYPVLSTSHARILTLETSQQDRPHRSSNVQHR
jgi:hypothetical protein